MNLRHVLSGLVVLAALGLSVWLGSLPTDLARPVDGVADAGGWRVPPASYHRIACCAWSADEVLVELVGHERLVTVSAAFAAANPHLAWVPAMTAVSPDLRGLDLLLSVRPDLVVISDYAGDGSHLQRLREAGLLVFDLGPMQGLASLRGTIAALGRVLAEEDRAAALIAALERDLAAVAADIPPARRREAIFVDVFGDQLYGGTLGSSYHDVITAAGLVDVAAARVRDRTDAHRGWPRYHVEDLLLLDPTLIVTTTGKAAVLQQLPGLQPLCALRDAAGIVELPSAVIDDPGLGVLRAARMLRARVYGR